MDVKEVFGLVVAAVTGGALTKASEAVSTFRKGSAQAARIEAKSSQEDVSFALKVMREQMSNLSESVRQSRAEHAHCRKALLDLENKLSGAFRLLVISTPLTIADIEKEIGGGFNLRSSGSDATPLPNEEELKPI
jgi:hypothetical protein